MTTPMTRPLAPRTTPPFGDQQQAKLTRYLEARQEERTEMLVTLGHYLAGQMLSSEHLLALATGEHADLRERALLYDLERATAALADLASLADHPEGGCDPWPRRHVRIAAMLHRLQVALAQDQIDGVSYGGHVSICATPEEAEARARCPLGWLVRGADLPNLEKSLTPASIYWRALTLRWSLDEIGQALIDAGYDFSYDAPALDDGDAGDGEDDNDDDTADDDLFPSERHMAAQLDGSDALRVLLANDLEALDGARHLLLEVVCAPQIAIHTLYGEQYNRAYADERLWNLTPAASMDTQAAAQLSVERQMRNALAARVRRGEARWDTPLPEPTAEQVDACAQRGLSYMRLRFDAVRAAVDALSATYA